VNFPVQKVRTPVLPLHRARVWRKNVLATLSVARTQMLASSHQTRIVGPHRHRPATRLNVAFWGRGLLAGLGLVRRDPRSAFVCPLLKYEANLPCCSSRRLIIGQATQHMENGRGNPRSRTPRARPLEVASPWEWSARWQSCCWFFANTQEALAQRLPRGWPRTSPPAPAQLCPE